MVRLTDELRRLDEKSPMHAIQVELQQGYGLSPVEALVLARRVQELIDERLDTARGHGQITYQAIAVDEPPGKPLAACRKISVQLTLVGDEDRRVWAEEGPQALRRLRVYRLVHEALLQGGALTQEDLALLLGISLKSVKRIFAYYRQHGERLPSRGELQDIGPGVSHKIPIIRKYVQDLSFSRISRSLGQHGLDSMSRYLRHFALVMMLQDRGLRRTQMQSILGISQNLIAQYQALYAELDVPENARVLDRLRRTAFPGYTVELDSPSPPLEEGKKGAL